VVRRNRHSRCHDATRGETLVGDDVTIGHGAVLESCEIGSGALIGMNAVILQGAVVGAAALVAAGSVVASGMTIPPHHLAAGAPAVVKKEISGESLRWVTGSAAHYVELSRRYLANAAREGPPRIEETAE
jgi:carbonic anhydrase/acetyltransferase-like protein (isoleucine patch superfamily)